MQVLELKIKLVLQKIHLVNSFVLIVLMHPLTLVQWPVTSHIPSGQIQRLSVVVKNYSEQDMQVVVLLIRRIAEQPITLEHPPITENVPAKQSEHAVGEEHL